MAPTNAKASLEDRLARIPQHPQIRFQMDTRRLMIFVDFASSGPHPGEETVDHLLEMTEILPKYARDTRIVTILIFLKARGKDTLRLNQARRIVVERVVEEINNFSNLTKVTVCLSFVSTIYWDQAVGLSLLSTASGIQLQLPPFLALAITNSK